MPELEIRGLKETRVSPFWPQQWRGNATWDIRRTALILAKLAAAHDLCLPIPIAMHRIQKISSKKFSAIDNHFLEFSLRSTISVTCL